MARLSTQLAEIGVSAVLTSRAPDHGVWVPLYRMWERPSFPVLQISLNSARGVRRHLELGRRLAPLRGRGVMIKASGGAVHNLRRLDWSGHATPPAPWADAFVEALEVAMARGDEQALCEPWSLPGGRESHPTLEHYLPLLVAYGAALPGPLAPVHRGWSHGSLALHAYTG
ncbi:MAG: class III extradiol ring-cleavage dioxygenase [Pseudolabrys sp.]